MNISANDNCQSSGVTAAHALAECLRSGYRDTAIAILRRSLEMERGRQAIPAGWHDSLEELIAVCLDHSRASRGDRTLSTLDYVEALAQTDGIASTLRDCSPAVSERLLAKLTV